MIIFVKWRMGPNPSTSGS